MKILVQNSNRSLTLCLSLLKIFGFLVRGQFTDTQKIFLRAYTIFWWTFVVGIYIVVQAGDLLQIWGDLPLMVQTSFLLFTNVAFGMKIINIIIRGDAVQSIIDETEEELAAESRVEGKKIVNSCNRETSQLLYLYICLSVITVLGWGASADADSLPLRAWYPYDTSKSPAYELTYSHQIIALLCGASLNVSLDTLVTSLIAVCRCRLRLLDLSLRNLCSDIPESSKNAMLTPDQDELIMSRLKRSVHRHQAVLRTSSDIQRLFSEPILAQFAVSMVIICVTAYQLAVELHSSPRNVVRILSMITYFLSMILQIFLYCHQGNQLSIESSELASAAYHCPWYLCSLRFRRALLVTMTRAKRDVRIVACGLTTLSLACFTAIIKASYTFFTVLQRVEDRRN